MVFKYRYQRNVSIVYALADPELSSFVFAKVAAGTASFAQLSLAFVRILCGTGTVH